MAGAKQGDTAVVHYKGWVKDGATFINTWGKGPLVFKLGERKVKPFFEKAVLGMEAGSKTTIEVSPDEGYGPYRHDLIAEIPLDHFPPGEELEVGKVIRLESDLGWIQAEVVKLTDTIATIDPNHPLTDKHLVYEIDLLEIERATED